MSKKQVRPETGPMQFGEDWTGVFIRGDNALFYASQIGMFLERVSDEKKDKMGINLISSIEELHKELKSCFASNGTPKGTQLVKDFTEVSIGNKKSKSK